MFLGRGLITYGADGTSRGKQTIVSGDDVAAGRRYHLVRINCNAVGGLVCAVEYVFDWLPVVQYKRSPALISLPCFV
jgi:hypothetical protein